MRWIAVLIFSGVASVSAGPPFKESDLIGTWHNASGNLVAVEITYAADHQYVFRCMGIVTGKMTGSWRMEKDQIITTWTGGEMTSLVTKKVMPPDRGEKVVEIIKLSHNTLSTKEAGDSDVSHYTRGAQDGRMDVADKPVHFPTPQETHNKAIHDLAAASTPEERLNALGRAAKQQLTHGEFKEARAEAQELLTLGQKYREDPRSAKRFEHNACYLDAIEDGNLVLGLCDVQEGQLEDAGQALLASASVPGCTSTSFGPNMRLAKALLEKGQREVVLKYLDLCRKFWQEQVLKPWIEQVKRGEIPDFGANLDYGFDG